MGHAFRLETSDDETSVSPLPIRRVGIIGAGQMGAGIAEAHARVGFSVVLVDVDGEQLRAGLDRVRSIRDRRARRNEAAIIDDGDISERISTSTDFKLLADCDLVIEAVVEDEAIKAGVFRDLVGLLKDTAIVASNTSTIPISRMAVSAPDPKRFAGMHFFHPVDRLKLVEIIRGARTDDETIATIESLVGKLEKTAIVVNDCPGFLTTRLLYFYLRESLRLVDEGVSPDAIDHAALAYGMPMGPIALMDLIGLDTVSSIFRVMAEGYPDRAESCPLLSELVAAGRLGRKSGAGFRAFDGRILPAKAQPEIMADEARIIDRLFLTMVLEATRILDEGIVRKSGDIDLGVMLGLAFPARRGGLLHWCDSLGAREVLDRVKQLEALGNRFRPTERLKRMAASSEVFYSND